MPSTLVIAEHHAGKLKLATLSAAAFAAKVSELTGVPFEILVIGENVGTIANQLQNYGAAAVIIADHSQLKDPVGDKYAQLLADIAKQRGATTIGAAASTFSKDVLPRAAALLDTGMLSDVTEIIPEKDGLIFKRVMFAGNIIATVRLNCDVKVITVRPSGFPPASTSAQSSPIVNLQLDPGKLPDSVEYHGTETKAAGRPDSTEARVVVSGGRALKNSEDFERLVGGLADTLGAAVGSSRALVDSGITPNSLQVGQTGKIVAPELYIAVGISGAIQHLAGIKDAKVIVAINKDPDAPIFEVADYGLVADVYQAVPELIEILKR
jgi:electron transfer flavoprotein alpha subunit